MTGDEETIEALKKQLDAGMAELAQMRDAYLRLWRQYKALEKQQPISPVQADVGHRSSSGWARLSRLFKGQAR